MSQEHPLNLAIKLRGKAKRKRLGAHPAFIQRLEDRVKEEAAKVNVRMGGNAMKVFDQIVGEVKK